MTKETIGFLFLNLAKTSSYYNFFLNNLYLYRSHLQERLYKITGIFKKIACTVPTIKAFSSSSPKVLPLQALLSVVCLLCFSLAKKTYHSITLSRTACSLMPLWFQGLRGYCLTARPLSVILIMVYQPSLGLPPSALLRVRQIELDLRAVSPLQQLFLKSVESLARLVHHQNCWIIQI